MKKKENRIKPLTRYNNKYLNSIFSAVQIINHFQGNSTPRSVKKINKFPYKVLIYNV